MATFTAIKNRGGSSGALGGVLHYVQLEEKTTWGDRRLVSGWNCTAQSVYDEMHLTKEQFHKTDGRQYYHFVQSFDKQDIAAHTALLREVSNRRELCPAQAQMEALTRDVAEIQALLRQAGKKKEISVSPPSLETALSVLVWLALILLGTLVGMVVLRTIWSGLAALWSVIKLLIP